MKEIELKRHPETGVLVPEKWKSIKGYEDWYDVSNYGRIRSWKGINQFAPRRDEPKLLNPKIDKYGYPHLGIRHNGDRTWHTVHRLVATAFVSNPENKPHVNHIDNERANNFYLNLEWCTPKENTAHGIKKGNIEFIGEKHPSAKLTKQDILEIRDLADKEDITNKELAEEYGVASGYISQIIHRSSWKHI